MTDAVSENANAGHSEVPLAPTPRTVVVAIGASAGGLAALKRFFATVPPDTGLAFVVVVHLPAAHDSYLADVIQPHSAIPITQVTEETLIQPNRAYVIPPARSLSAVDSHLRLAPLDAPGVGRAPIDHFFRTLAQTHDGSSVGVVLSGTGSDGAQGIRYVREQGGLTVVQDPDEAEFDGMPRSAIDTGLVDEVLPIAAMVARIRQFAATRPDVSAGAESGRPAPGTAPTNALVNALTLVRLRTGHDFLRYKRSTVMRRIARRMQVLNLTRLEEYVDHLRADEKEPGALIDDLLINVTSFFRDASVFELLEKQVIPQLFEGKARGDAVRVWSVGCATGEEAYSLGMLLLEEAERRPHAPQIQVFATDLHEPSIVKAREGLFGEAIEAEVAPERLRRFFRRELGGYRVAKPLRDVVVFATHNLLHDPPFSRQNLIVCRNMLIYLQRDLQSDVIELFHYALARGGRLLLGSAETLDRSELFRLESRESHLYQRRHAQRGLVRMPTLTVAPAVRVQPTGPDAPAQTPPARETSYAAAHRRLVEQYAAPSLLVGPGHEVVHFSDRVGPFLQHPSGQPTHDLFRLVRDEFRQELRTALHMVRDRRESWQSRPITSRSQQGDQSVVLRVSPAVDSMLEGFVLVVFEDATEAATPTHPADKDASVRELETELESSRARMQAVIEEFETTQEAMQASNEELQSANEELRSTLEELETSREELQSVNEELQTLNQENRHKVEELSQLSSDLQNLLQSTDIATIFLDRNLRILRYTPRVGEIFNVRPTDRGRPLADITHKLGYPDLIADTRRVLETLIPVEREATTDRGAIYRLRAAPYRTVDDRIEGAVITMVDITALKHAQAALHAGRERQTLLLRLQDATTPISDLSELRQAASRLLSEHLKASRVAYAEPGPDGYVIKTGHARGVDALSPDIALPEFDRSFRDVYGRGDALVISNAATDPSLTVEQRELYAAVNVASLVAVMLHRKGEWLAGLTVQCDRPRVWTDDEVGLIGDVAERIAVAVDRARADNAVKFSEAQFRHIVEGARDYAILTTDLEGRILSWSPGAEAVLGWTAEEAVGQPLDMTFTLEDRAQGAPENERAQAIANGFAPDVRWHLRHDGARVFIDGTARALTDTAGVATKILKVGQDVTERRRMEQALQQLNESLEERVRERTQQLEAAGRAARERDTAFRRRLGQAEEAERRRLARDLHDEAGQLLTALGLGLKAVFDVAPADSELARRTEKLRELADNLGRELHTLAVRLRPKALDDFGLEAAIETYAEQWGRLSGVELSVHAPRAAERLSEAVETAIYRIVQEALTNIARHSGARRASVLVERRDGSVVAVIEDDGRGLDPATIEDTSAAGIGLRGIRERAALLGGTAEIESAAGAGTTVFVRIPVADDPA